MKNPRRINPNTGKSLPLKPPRLDGYIDNCAYNFVQNFDLVAIFRRHMPAGRSHSKIAFSLIAIIVGVIVRSITHIATFAYTMPQGPLTDFLRREDIRWREIVLEILSMMMKFYGLTFDAFAIDDTLKPRSGQVEGSGYHFDHAKGNTVYSQSVVSVVFVDEENGTLPCDSQMWCGKKDLPATSKDGRRAAQRNYREAVENDKNEIARHMISRALEKGLRAQFVLGDAWFGNKKNIEFCLAHDLTALFQMKRNMTYYHRNQSFSAKQLYHLVRKKMQPVLGTPYSSASLIVKINLETRPNKPAIWQDILLVFSRLTKNKNPESWVYFGCTDTTMKAAEVLSKYTLRWGIEVWFKEAKHNLGMLDNKGASYATSVASLYLAHLRYLMIYDYMKRTDGKGFADARKELVQQLEMLIMLPKCWKVIKLLIQASKETLSLVLGQESSQRAIDTICEFVDEYLTRALWLSEDKLKELKIIENEVIK